MMGNERNKLCRLVRQRSLQNLRQFLKSFLRRVCAQNEVAVFLKFCWRGV